MTTASYHVSGGGWGEKARRPRADRSNAGTAAARPGHGPWADPAPPVTLLLAGGGEPAAAGPWRRALRQEMVGAGGCGPARPGGEPAGAGRCRRAGGIGLVQRASRSAPGRRPPARRSCSGPEILLRAGGRLQPRQLLVHHRRRRHLDRRHGRRLVAAARGPCSEPADDSDPAAPRYDPAAPFATAGPPPVTLLRAGGRRGHQQRLDRLRRRSRFDRRCRLAAAALQPAASGVGPAHSGSGPCTGPQPAGMSINICSFRQFLSESSRGWVGCEGVSSHRETLELRIEFARTKFENAREHTRGSDLISARCIWRPAGRRHAAQALSERR